MHPASRLFQHPDPAAALGMAVSHLMIKPAFAHLPFGSWARILVGQINRRQYHLAVDPSGRVIGFLGWAIANETTANAWLMGKKSTEDTLSGDCVIINAWSAETLAVNRLLLAAARDAAAGHRIVYFKRHYPDGSTRKAKMAVPQPLKRDSRFAVKFE